MSQYPDWYRHLLDYLLGFMPMPKRFGVLLYPKMIKPFTANEDAVLLSPGKISEMAYWPIEGYIRRYVITKPEDDSEFMREITTDISVPNNIYLATDSYMNQIPADFYLEIKKGSSMAAFHYTSFMELAQTMPEVHQLATKILAHSEKNWLKKTEICKVNNKKSYQIFKLFFNDPLGSKMLLQKEIASYLGIREERLSRILKGSK